MNVRGADIIDPVGLAYLQADLRGLLTDSDVATAVTVSTPSTTATDYASGGLMSLSAQDAVMGLLEELSLREITSSSGRYQIGDQRIRIMAADLSTSPSLDSTVTAGSDVYAVLNATRDVLGLHWLLVLRLRN